MSYLNIQKKSGISGKPSVSVSKFCCVKHSSLQYWKHINMCIIFLTLRTFACQWTLSVWLDNCFLNAESHCSLTLPEILNHIYSITVLTKVTWRLPAPIPSLARLPSGLLFVYFGWAVVLSLEIYFGLICFYIEFYMYSLTVLTKVTWRLPAPIPSLPH